MTDIAPLGPAIRGTIESNMQEAKDKLMPVWHMLRCETNKKQFLNVIDVLDEIFDADMNGKTLLRASIQLGNTDLDLATNGYMPL